MKMVASVWAYCPHCGNSIKFQTKVGPNFMHNYRLRSVPSAVAERLDGASQTCDHCQMEMKIGLSAPVARVAMECKALDYSAGEL